MGGSGSAGAPDPAGAARQGKAIRRMTHSMTGFGKAAWKDAACDISVEVRAVNHRYLTVKCRLPAVLAEAEGRFQEILRRRIRRGSVDLSVRLETAKPLVTWQVNESALQSYLGAAARLSRLEGIRGGELSLESALALPGVIESRECREIPAAIVRAARRAVEDAVERLDAMRAAEGRRLAAFLVRRRRSLETLVKRIARRAPAAARRQQQKLKRRVAELLAGQPLPPGDPTLAREIAFLADRLDVTEELERLQSHFEQFDRTLAGEGAAGRALEFLVQEIGREINTIGSKSSDAATARLVVAAKAELEKIREQVQNIE